MILDSYLPVRAANRRRKKVVNAARENGRGKESEREKKEGEREKEREKEREREREREREIVSLLKG